jgi:hypothetical protein
MGFTIEPRTSFPAMTSGGFRPTPRLAHMALRCLTLGLVLFSLAMAVKGLRRAWLFDGDMDMQTRVAEYAAFRQGIYPTPPVETHIPAGMRVPYTVYPPYALPMFAVFFEPFGKVQGRIVIELLSLVSLIAIAVYGHNLLRDWGPAAAGLGAVAALAISGNGNAIALGQFSILCAGALLMQIVSLARDRPLAAGAWWALAMIKPQIGLAFAGLFLVRREWRGLACGLGILVGLSLAACWWTEVSPLALVNHWLFRMNMGFAESYSLAGRLAAALGVQPRIVHLGATGLLALATGVLMARTRRGGGGTDADPLVLGGIAALLGGVLFYHPFYDNSMMFPLLFIALAAAARRPTPGRLAIAAVLGFSLWLPEQLIAYLPLAWMVRASAWIACSVALIAVSQTARVPGECQVALSDRDQHSNDTVTP